MQYFPLKIEIFQGYIMCFFEYYWYLFQSLPFNIFNWNLAFLEEQTKRAMRKVFEENMEDGTGLLHFLKLTFHP